MYESDTCDSCAREFPYYLAKRCEKCIKKLCPVCIFVYIEYIDKPPQLWGKFGLPQRKIKVCPDCHQKLLEEERVEREMDKEEHKEEHEDRMDYDAEYSDDY